MTHRRSWPVRILASAAVAALAATLGPEASAMPAPAGVPTVVRASTVGAAAPSAATPPAGITCRTLAGPSVTNSCVIGRSVEGRPIVATRQGNPTASRVLVVNGQMHGEEWPGTLVVDQIRALGIRASVGYQIWTVRTLNPDGGRIGRRRNSHGVDLNRNFPNKFLRMSDSGPRALSEPESAAMVRFLTWVQPDLVISLHGFSTSVDTTGGGTRAAWARSFSRLANITPAKVVSCSGPCHGNMTDWYSATSRVHGVAFTVEMPRSSKVVRRCAVPGRATSLTTIRCSAYAALYLAARLPA
jgi:predicted deacylase